MEQMVSACVAMARSVDLHVDSAFFKKCRSFTRDVSEMIMPFGAVVFVADGASFRMFRNNASEPHIALEAIPVADVVVENEGSGSRHRNSSANPDASRLDEDNYVSSLAGYLNRQVLDGKIQKLFIVADPRSLGELRKHFHAALEATLIGQVAKDSTGHSIDAIESAVAKAW